MEIGKHWDAIRSVFDEAYKSCLHFAVATVNEGRFSARNAHRRTDPARQPNGFLL